MQHRTATFSSVSPWMDSCVSEFSEVELVDVLYCEGYRWTGDDNVLLAELALAQGARLEFCASRGLQCAGSNLIADLSGEVALIVRAPQCESLDRSVLDEPPHLVGRAQAGDFDLLRFSRRFDTLRGGCNADGC